MSKDQEEHEFEDKLADEENSEPKQLRSLLEGLTAIMKEIRDFKKEMKEDLSKFKDEFKEEVRQEFAGFKEEINRKVAQNIMEIQQQWKDITEAQERITESEDWNVEASFTSIASTFQERNQGP